ncbi:MAG: hypothetical protein ACRD0C_03540 [Acidimicrobiia bacterium]
MQEPFDKNKALARGYLDWCTTEPEEWEGNMVGQLLAANVTLDDEELSDHRDGRAAVLEKLADLKRTTIVDPLSVRVGTTHGPGDESFGCDRERMDDPARGRSGWHTCFDRFEWTGEKISAIYVCPADDHSLSHHH